MQLHSKRSDTSRGHCPSLLAGYRNKSVTIMGRFGRSISARGAQQIRQFNLTFLRVIVFTILLAMGCSTIAFAAPPNPTFKFKGEGGSEGGSWGGGMAQYGAVEMAKAGKNVDTILKYYYTGVSIKTLPTPTKNARVGLNNKGSSTGRSSWRIRPGYKGATMTVGGVPYADKSSGSYKFTVEGGKVAIDGKTTGKTVITIVPTSTGTGSKKDVSGQRPLLTEIVDSSGPDSWGSTGTGKTHVRWRGKIELKVSGTKLICMNVVPMQDYLKGVVPRELNTTYLEASKAQAICARSEVWARVKSGSTLPCTTAVQNYSGHSYFTGDAQRNGGSWTNREAATANKAVDGTKNKCLTSPLSNLTDKVATSYYNGDNGDCSVSAKSAWGGSGYPWVVSKNDDWIQKANRKNHYWTEKTTGLALAAKFRDKWSSSRFLEGWTPTSAAGKTVSVTELKLTYATDSPGWVYRVDVTWSNGKTSYIWSCDKVRIMMGFRTARFIKGTTGTIPRHGSSGGGGSGGGSGSSTKTYEETSSSIKRTGTWEKVTNKGHSGGAIVVSKKKDASFSLSFKGSGIWWIGPKASTYGDAKVYIDGKLKKTIKVKSTKTLRQQSLYGMTGLSVSKTHTIKIVVAGNGNVGLDKLIVTGGSASPTASTKSYQETSSLIKRTKTWSSIRNGSYSGGKAASTKKKDATVTVKFKGSKISWYGTTSPSGGKVAIYKDGDYSLDVDLKSTKTKRGVLLYSLKTTNSSVTHTLKLKNKSAKPMVLDRFVVEGGTLVK